AFAFSDAFDCLKLQFRKSVLHNFLIRSARSGGHRTLPGDRSARLVRSNFALQVYAHRPIVVISTRSYSLFCWRNTSLYQTQRFSTTSDDVDHQEAQNCSASPLPSVDEYWPSCVPMTRLSIDEWQKLTSDFSCRLINKKTFEKFHVRLSPSGDGLVFPLFSHTGQYIAQSPVLLRMMQFDSVEDGSLPCTKSTGNGLFGYNTVSSKNDVVVLVMTEWDAMFVHQQSGLPVVAFSGDAVTFESEVLGLIAGFRKVIFWFPSSEIDRVKQFMAILGPERSYYISPSLLKGMTIKEYYSKPPRKSLTVLQCLSKCLRMFHPYISSVNELRKSVFDYVYHQGLCQGFAQWNRLSVLNSYLGGLRPGELTVFSGPTGSGKTTFISLYSLDLCEQLDKQALYSIEREMLWRQLLLSLTSRKVDETVTREELESMYDRLALLPLHFTRFNGSFEFRDVIHAIEHHIEICDIRHVVVDNLQFLAGAVEQHLTDRFAVQDMVFSEFRRIASEKSVHLTLVVHPRKEMDSGQLTLNSLYGGVKASQEADNVYILQVRQMLEPGGTPKIHRYFQILKNRRMGELEIGNRLELKFNHETLTHRIIVVLFCGLLLVELFSLSRLCCPPKEMTSRRVAIAAAKDDATRYPPNLVRNQKHSALFFLPAVLIEQFRFFLNLFFLIMALSQFLPQLRIGYLSTYWGPLVSKLSFLSSFENLNFQCFVLTITICREAYDDFKRYVRDKELNSMLYELVTPIGSKMTKSSSIQVGDVLKIHKDQRIPADAVLLHTSDKVGACFVRTDQLDGETDWKLKIACPLAQQVDNELALFDMNMEIFAEKPQKNIHVFFGTLKTSDQFGEQEEALNVDNILWRDTVLAAGSAVCAVVYTGCETRAALNTSQPRSKVVSCLLLLLFRQLLKVGLFDREVNNLTKILFVLAFLLALLMVGLKGFIGVWPVTFFRFLLLFSYVIPLSLRVNLDMAKVVYAWLISKDKEIPGTVVRSSTIPEELGRIQYLLCDKTGTLTQNNMIFKKLHLGTVMFNQETFDEISSQLRLAFSSDSEASGTQSLTFKVRLALEALVLCNNVTPVQDDDSEADETQNSYQASSPDEVALVSWACDMGLKLLYRDLNTIIIKDPLNREQSYKILQTFPFTSERKRMGIIVQKEGTDEITFYIKGADVVLQPIVSYNDWLEEECANLAREGLRTLVVAKKVLTVQQYKAFSVNAFHASYDKAKLSLYDRQTKVNEVVSMLERDLQLLCLTGVEDQLQVDVRITLELLKNAGVKAWMLTGDKVETAFCIAKSSGLISRGQNVFRCPTVHTPREALQELEKLRSCSSSLLVISSASLEFYLAYLPEEFINASSACTSVVCCRCSPEQLIHNFSSKKAEVVRTLKKYNGGKLVAAIGDGGNDVSMIQAADVGIGIVGKEGRHASLAADFSITQFRSLARLLLWHGRLCYRRSCSLSQFVIHRGLIITTMQAVFSCIFYFASVSLYPGMLMVLYSTVYTMFPVFSLVMDRDAKEKVVLTFPDLYKDLVKGRSLSLKTFLIWFLISMYQGAVIMYGGIFLFESDFIHIVSISFTSLVITELIMVALTIHTWHWSMVAAECLSVTIYVLSLLFLPNVFDIKYVRTWSFIWKTLVLTTISCLPLVLLKLVRLMFAPPNYAKLS
ncbi:hypothetical protein M513_02631, partial [Trichuris suis]